MMTDIPPSPKSPWRHLPLALILSVAVLGAFAFRDFVTFEALARHRETLLAFRDAHFLWASLGFVVTYTVIVALSVPGATVATLAGGFLFGMFPGTLYNVAAATLGAGLVFLAARAGLGADVAARIEARGGAAARLQQGLRGNQWSVLLMMRLVPVVPFFLANLIPAFAGIRLVPFVVTTALGIVPAGLVFTSIGAGLGEVFAKGEVPDLSVIFSAPILLPLLGLAALSALPMVVKAIRRKGS
jgi:uncharacterized membrane protein YdjX (TVP38/TMEM64 family)